MKGYKIPFKMPEPVQEVTLVGCRRCNNLWREMRWYHTDARINGPCFDYDYCDKCITDEEKLKIGQL